MHERLHMIHFVHDNEQDIASRWSFCLIDMFALKDTIEMRMEFPNKSLRLFINDILAIS